MKQQGMTLVELMVTLAVLGIVTAYAVPSFGQMIKNHQMAAQADNYYSVIYFARAEAVRTGRVITVDAVNSDWSKGAVVKDGTNELRKVKGKDTITVTQSNGDNSISFNGKGFLASDFNLTFCDGKRAQDSRLIRALSSGFFVVQKAAEC